MFQLNIINVQLHKSKCTEGKCKNYINGVISVLVTVMTIHPTDAFCSGADTRYRNKVK